MPSVILSAEAIGRPHLSTGKPFRKDEKKFPSPRASSTPIKFAKAQPHDAANGQLNRKRTSEQQGGSPGKKRKVAYMDLSEEETGIAVHVNGHLPHGHGSLPNGKTKAEQASQKISKAQKFAALQEQRSQLPIARGKDALIREIREHDTVILLGETGSGKTTQVPQYILESGLAGMGMIAVTQPRRVAATSLAARVAQEQNVAVGKLVGYSVRFDEASTSETRIKYVTDGMLARELHSDPTLSRYNAVIIDEAHERTLNTDLLIASLKGIQKARNGKVDAKGKAKAAEGKNLKIIIMSATLDAEKFSRFYDNAKVLYVKGRQHPVTIFHTATSQTDYVDSALRTFFQIHTDQPPGDVLIFLPGQEDIEGLEKAIKMYAAQMPAEQMRILTCPMYAALPQSQQSKAFSTSPAGMRKCILATNIAETSITIPGVKYVVDSGKCKEKKHVARLSGSGIDTLLTQDISKSSAMQRAGRAGREGPGMCFRLYTEADFNQLPVSSVPEIQRCSLTSSMLQMKCLGQDLDALDFMDKPDGDAIISALKTLFILGAINEKRELTQIGREMNNFPLEPPLARALLASKEFGCSREVIDLISVLSASSKLFFDTTDQRDQALEARGKFRHPSGDHLTTLNAFRAYQDIAAVESKGGRKDWCRKQFLNERTLNEAMAIREQLQRIGERVGLDWKSSCGDHEEPVLKSFLKGMAQHTALLRAEGGYKQVMGLAIVKIHPGSTMCDRKAPAIMYDELVFTGSSYARGVSAIPHTLLSDLTAFSMRSAA